METPLTDTDHNFFCDIMCVKTGVFSNLKTKSYHVQESLEIKAFLILIMCQKNNNKNSSNVNYLKIFICSIYRLSGRYRGINVNVNTIIQNFRYFYIQP